MFVSVLHLGSFRNIGNAREISICKSQEVSYEAGDTKRSAIEPGVER